MAETKNNNGLKVLAGLLGVILLGTIIYTVSLYQEKKKKEAVLEQEKEVVVGELESLRSEYDKAILESNKTNEELVEARDNIAKYIDSVSAMKADLATLSRYRRQVSVLKKEREQLMRQVDSLKQSNTMIAMQRDSTFAELEKQTVFNDSLIVQNTQLAEAVERGSALNLTQFSVDAVRERNNGTLRSTSRARRTDKLKVCFTVADNVIAEAGDREFYIEVLDPQGNVMGGSNSKSIEDGPTITYTKNSAVYYENAALDVCDYISNYTGEFKEGNYMVNVYDDSLKLLGTSRFELK